MCVLSDTVADEVDDDVGLSATNGGTECYLARLHWAGSVQRIAIGRHVTDETDGTDGTISQMLWTLPRSKTARITE